MLALEMVLLYRVQLMALLQLQTEVLVVVLLLVELLATEAPVS